MERYREILAFWFGPGSDAKLWFGGDETTDRAVRERFSADVADAAAGRLSAWEDSPESTVALVVLLDQFSLQLHRKQRQGYEQAALALPIAERALAKGFDRRLGCEKRGFLYMPFMHAEDLGLQERSVTLFAALAAECGGRAAMTGFLQSAEQHRQVVRKYGRFPGRNKAYGRAATAEEQVYLDRGGHF
jgi:uncharacterized protein (DUF924 family)